MKILVLGATGATGRLIVGKAIAKGYEVAALVRSQAKAVDLAGAELVEGDARDPAALTRAIAGCDAVVSSLGTAMSPFREVTLLSTATRALVGVMEQQNIRRLVCITGLGAGDSRGHGGFFFDRLFLPLMLRKVYEDKDRQEDAIRVSTLDWTIVRPTVLNDKPVQGHTKLSNDTRDEDLDGPAGFDSRVQRKREFAADMGLQAHVLRMAAEGAVSAYEDITGETWKPYERTVEQPANSVDQKAATAQMAAFE